MERLIFKVKYRHKDGFDVIIPFDDYLDALSYVVSSVIKGTFGIKDYEIKRENKEYEI